MMPLVKYRKRRMLVTALLLIYVVTIIPFVAFNLSLLPLLLLSMVGLIGVSMISYKIKWMIHNHDKSKIKIISVLTMLVHCIAALSIFATARDMGYITDLHLIHPVMFIVIVVHGFMYLDIKMRVIDDTYKYYEIE